MTTDTFAEAARAEAELKHPVPDAYDPRVSQYERLLAQGAFRAGAEWARDHLAAQEPTDAEVLAALNAQGVVVSPKMHPAPSLDYWGDKPAEAMRAALTAARAARRDEE